MAVSLRRENPTSRTAHGGEGFNVFGVVGGKLWLRNGSKTCKIQCSWRVPGEGWEVADWIENESKGGRRYPALGPDQDDMSANLSGNYATSTMRSPNRACTTPGRVSWTVRVWYKVDHFKSRGHGPVSATQIHGNQLSISMIGRFPGKFKSPSLAHSDEGVGKRNQSASCIWKTSS